MVIAFAQPRMGSLEVMKSRSPGQEKCGSLRGWMCRQAFVLQRKVTREARTMESPVGLGTRALTIQGPRPSFQDAWFSLELGSRSFLLRTSLSYL